MQTKRHIPLILALSAGVLLFLATPTSASASDRHRVTVGVSVHTPVRQVVEQRWVPGHYEERTERVLLEAGHHREEWVPPVYERRIGRRGHVYRVKVREGYYRRVWVEPVYQTRVVKTWVPGHHVEVVRPARRPCVVHRPVVVHRPPCVVHRPVVRPVHHGHGHWRHHHSDRPRVGFGVSFRF